jgi:hypothetical protein
MPTATQLNLSLDNEIGTLARLSRDLANGGVNLLALSKAGYTFAVEEVLFIELKNRPGALAKAVEKLARARINIRYAYATASSRTRRTAAVVAVPEVELSRALQLLG